MCSRHRDPWRAQGVAARVRFDERRTFEREDERLFERALEGRIIHPILEIGDENGAVGVNYVRSGRTRAGHEERARRGEHEIAAMAT